MKSREQMIALGYDKDWMTQCLKCGSFDCHRYADCHFCFDCKERKVQK